MDKQFFTEGMRKTLKGFLSMMVFRQTISITEDQANVEIELYLKELFGDMTFGDFKDELKKITKDL